MFGFSSSKLVDRPFDWAYQLKDLGYSGWEIVNEGKQKLTRENLVEAKQIVETTDLIITIHLPYSDLNLASVNQPIWEETVRQMKSCLDLASDFARLAVLHPGHFSPLGMHMPDAAWSQCILGHPADLRSRPKSGHQNCRGEHGQHACHFRPPAGGVFGNNRDGRPGECGLCFRCRPCQH